MNPLEKKIKYDFFTPENRSNTLRGNSYPRNAQLQPLKVLQESFENSPGSHRYEQLTEERVRSNSDAFPNRNYFCRAVRRRSFSFENPPKHKCYEKSIDDKNLILSHIANKNFKILLNASESIKKDPEVIYKIIYHQPSCLTNLQSHGLSNSPLIFLIAFKYYFSRYDLRSTQSDFLSHLVKIEETEKNLKSYLLTSQTLFKKTKKWIEHGNQLLANKQDVNAFLIDILKINQWYQSSHDPFAELESLADDESHAMQPIFIKNPIDFDDVIKGLKKFQGQKMPTKNIFFTFV